MNEILIAAGILGGIGAAVWAHGAFAWEHLLAAGSAAITLGLLVGVPTGFYYHVKLYRALSPRMELPSGWWLRPDRLHAHLTEAEDRSMRPWYVAGGIGFFVFLAGAVLCGIAIIPSLP